MARLNDRCHPPIVSEKKADLEYLMGLVEARHLKPVIDSSYAMKDIVEAHRRVDTGRKAGSVVVRVGPG